MIYNPLKYYRPRLNDPTGLGHYGAKRGTRKHKGFDLEAKPGSNVTSPICGTVTKLGYCYNGDNHYRYVEVTGEVYRVRLLYVKPAVKKGQVVFIGNKVGTAQDISKKWSSLMHPHIHVEVYKYGLLTDPEPLIIK